MYNLANSEAYLSIHDLLAEVDGSSSSSSFSQRSFQFTTSSRRSTRKPLGVLVNAVLSIHDLLAEVDHVDRFPQEHLALSIHDLLAEVDGAPVSTKY